MTSILNNLEKLSSKITTGLHFKGLADTYLSIIAMLFCSNLNGNDIEKIEKYIIEVINSK